MSGNISPKKLHYIPLSTVIKYIKSVQIGKTPVPYDYGGVFFIDINCKADFV